ncbi:hypothetical protein BDD12DRAFT_887012 [Trichophaea hybrida]|nr:hypothetical protein BDD12DRAFT_887012 [Trichophaea hybrida]
MYRSTLPQHQHPHSGVLSYAAQSSSELLGTREEKLRAALSAGFSEVERGIKTEATIVPSCDSTDETKVALISFTPQIPAFLEPLMKDGLEDTQFVTKVGELNIDRRFFGLTQLYPTAQGEMILADIVAVTGLDGHAYGS